MQNESMASISKDHTQAVSLREQRLVEQIKKQLLDIHTSSPDEIEQLLLALPENYQKMAIHVVAEHFVTAAKFHLLQIVATFYQKAESEGIDTEERNATLQDVEADIHDIITLDQRLNIDVLKNLFKLGKITASANDLSQCENAEKAQGWIYNLPTIYQGRLEREHLTRRELSTTFALPASPVEMQVKLMLSPSTNESASSIKDAAQQRPSTWQALGTSESRQWGKILSHPRQPNTTDFQTKEFSIEAKYRLSS